MSLRKLVEDYTLTEDPLPREDIVDIDVEKYHPYYPGVPIGASGRTFESQEEREKRERYWLEYYDSHSVNCQNCGEILGLDKHIEYLHLRFQEEQKTGRCPHCKIILWDYRLEPYFYG